MTKKNKLVERLKRKPRDFEWKEAKTLLEGLGFIEKQGEGSRVKFYHEGLNHVIFLHAPHPSKIMKLYAVKQLLDDLINKELI